MQCAGATGYVTRTDLAAVRIRREERCTLTALHEEIALGESGLLWELLKVDVGGGGKGIPIEALRVFLVEERLPEGIGRRRVSLLGAREVGGEVGKIMRLEGGV